jgi:hypothetical protein
MEFGFGVGGQRVSVGFPAIAAAADEGRRGPAPHRCYCRASNAWRRLPEQDDQGARNVERTAMSLPIFEKQQEDVLDYTVDLSAWIPAGDQPQSFVCHADAGITVGASVVNPGALAVVQWLSGGTSGNSYHIQLVITTVQGRTKAVDFNVKVKEF